MSRVMNEPSRSASFLKDSEANTHGECSFSPMVTAICFVICVCGFGLLLWSVVTSSSVVSRDSETGSRDLERISSRLLAIDSRLTELSAFEQTLHHIVGHDGDTHDQLRQWYEEWGEERRTPLDDLYMGILDGEAGRREAIRNSIEEWSVDNSLSPTFHQLLDVGYLEREKKNTDFDLLQAKLAEDVPANWFYFQLARRLANQADHRALQGQLQQQFQELTNPQLWKWRVLVLLETALVGIGALCVAFLSLRWIKQRAGENVGTHALWRSQWTFQEGMALLVRGGALSILLIATFPVLPFGLALLENYGSLLLYLPTVILFVVWFCRPKGQSLLEVLGCHHLSHGLRTSLPVVFSIIGLGIIGDWLIMLGGGVLEISVHWTEWFLPQLIWGTRVEVLKTVLEVVVLAPIFEEIIFRGILFSTFRARWSFPLSMIGSSMIFALAHGYGVVAFLAVFWSGLLWAWLYERTGSVIPGMCAHAINNGLVVSYLVGVFR